MGRRRDTAEQAIWGDLFELGLIQGALNMRIRRSSLVVFLFLVVCLLLGACHDETAGTGSADRSPQPARG